MFFFSELVAVPTFIITFSLFLFILFSSLFSLNISLFLLPFLSDWIWFYTLSYVRSVVSLFIILLFHIFLDSIYIISLAVKRNPNVLCFFSFFFFIFDFSNNYPLLNTILFFFLFSSDVSFRLFVFLIYLFLP